MNDAITIDKAGRLVLPQHVRRHLGLEAGDVLDVELSADAVVLRARLRRPELVEEHGLLVHEGTAEGDLVRAVDRVRAGRDATALGVRS